MNNLMNENITYIEALAFKEACTKYQVEHHYSFIMNDDTGNYHLTIFTAGQAVVLLDESGSEIVFSSIDGVMDFMQWLDP